MSPCAEGQAGSGEPAPSPDEPAGLEKLAAARRLAAGVAHELNNILTAIQGNAHLLQTSAQVGAESAEVVEEIVRASDRARELAERLRAFADGGKAGRTPVDVHRCLVDVVDDLKETLGGGIEVHLRLRAQQAITLGGAAQLRRALGHLVEHARDAMPGGGTLTISTDRVRLAPGSRRPWPDSMPAGEYVAVAVRDTGAGLDEDRRRRIFEPYARTVPGRKPSLALAEAHACVLRHRGAVRVESDREVGTTLTVLLPLAASPGPPSPPSQPGRYEPVRGSPAEPPAPSPRKDAPGSAGGR
jgi:signal transduction histidine kinase